MLLLTPFVKLQVFHHALQAGGTEGKENDASWLGAQGDMLDGGRRGSCSSRSVEERTAGASEVESLSSAPSVPFSKEERTPFLFGSQSP